MGRPEAVAPEDDTTDGVQDGKLTTAARFQVSSLHPSWIYNTLVPLFPAPLRFIYARNLEPLPGDRFRSFNFSLSASF